MHPRHLGPGWNIDKLILLPSQRLTPPGLERPCCKKKVLPAQQHIASPVARAGSSDLGGHLQLSQCIAQKIHPPPSSVNDGQVWDHTSLPLIEPCIRIPAHCLQIPELTKHLQGPLSRRLRSRRDVLDCARASISICSFCGCFRLAETQCILQARNPVKSWPRWIAGTMPPQALPSHPTSVVSAAPPLRTVRNGLEETRLQHTSEPGNWTQKHTVEPKRVKTHCKQWKASLVAPFLSDLHQKPNEKKHIWLVSPRVRSSDHLSHHCRFSPVSPKSCRFDLGV